MPWIILGLLAAATYVMTRGEPEAASTTPTADTAKEFDKGRDAGVLDAKDSIALSEKNGGAPVSMVTSRWQAAWAKTSAEAGYQTGYKAELLTTKPGYELEPAGWSLTGKVRRKDAAAGGNGGGGGGGGGGTTTSGGGSSSLVRTDAVDRFNLDTTSEDPLRGYVRPEAYASTPGASFADEMIARADYFWSYLSSLESVARKIADVESTNKPLADEQKKIVEALIAEDFRTVVDPTSLFIDNNTSSSEGVGGDLTKLVLAAQTQSDTSSFPVEAVIMGLRAVLGSASGEGMVAADDVRIQAIRSAMAYGVPFHVVTTGGADGQTKYYFGQMAETCVPAGLCSIVSGFTSSGLPEAQASRAKEAFSYLKYYVKDDPLSAAAFTVATFFQQNWMSSAPTGPELAKMTSSEERYYRRFYELLVAAIGVSAAAKDNVPVYEWSAIVSEAWKGWNGGVDGARKSGFGWPGASGVAFAYDYATQASRLKGRTPSIFPTEATG